MNRTISIIEIEPIINSLLKEKAPGTERFTGEFYPAVNEEIIPILYNLF